MPAKFIRLNLLMFFFVIFLLTVGLARAEETEIMKGPYSYSSVNLLELQKNPTAFRNQFVTFECKFAQTGSLYKEVQTGLLPELHQNFFAWAPSVRLWIPNDRKNLVCLTLYIIKASGSFKAMKKLTPLARIIVWGQVRSDLGGAPWIEVRQIDRAPGANLTENLVSSIFHGKSLLENGKHSSALPYFLNVLRENLPRMEEGAVCEYAGICYYNLGNFRLAAKFFDRAVELDPYNYELVKSQVKAYYRSKNYLVARNLAEKALQDNKELHDVRVILGLIKGLQGDVDSGLRDVEYVLLRDSYNIDAYKARAELFTFKGDYPSALKAIESAIIINQQNAELQYERAYLYEQMGDTEKAQQGYEISLSLQPGYTHALIALARLAMKRGDRAAAAKYLEMASSTDMPADKLVEIGWYFVEVGDSNKALTYFRLALDKDPNFVEALIAIGGVHLNTGNLIEAEQNFRRAYALVPGDRDVRFGLCRSILWQEKRNRDALEIARTLNTDFPKDATSLALLGFAMTLDGRADEAEPLLLSALKIEPTNIEFEYYLGYCLYMQKKFAESIPVLEDVVKAGGFFGAKAQALLDSARIEAKKNQGRMELLEEKRLRDEERANQAAEKKRLEMERREQMKAEREKRAEDRKTARSDGKTRPTMAKPDDKTVKAKSLYVPPKSRAEIKVAEVKKDETVRTYRKTDDKETISGAPASWLKKYGYKPYVPPVRKVVERKEMTWLPSADEVSRKIFEDREKRDIYEYEPYAYTIRQKHDKEAEYAKQVSKIKGKMDRARTADIKETNRRASKAIDSYYSERTYLEERREKNLRKAQKEIRKAVENLNKRYVRYDEEYKKQRSELALAAEMFVKEQSDMMAKAKQYADAYMKDRAVNTAELAKQSENMRKSVQAEIDKIETLMAEEEQALIAKQPANFARLRAEMEARQREINLAEEKRRKHEDEELFKRILELQRMDEEKAEAVRKIMQFNEDRDEDREEFAEKFEKLEKARLEAREENNKRLENLQKSGNKALADYEKYKKQMEEYRAKKVREFDEAQRERRERQEELDRRSAREREKASDKRLKGFSKRITAANADLKKAKEASDRRLAELQEEHQKAIEEAEQMQRRAQAERDRIKAQVEIDRKRMLENRYR